jgi:hypothetical protein
MSQEVWHVKQHSLLKAVSAKHRSKFAALSPEMVTAASYPKKLLVRLKTNKRTNKNCYQNSVVSM